MPYAKALTVLLGVGQEQDGQAIVSSRIHSPDSATLPCVSPLPSALTFLDVQGNLISPQEPASGLPLLRPHPPYPITPAPSPSFLTLEGMVASLGTHQLNPQCFFLPLSYNVCQQSTLLKRCISSVSKSTSHNRICVSSFSH